MERGKRNNLNVKNNIVGVSKRKLSLDRSSSKKIVARKNKSANLPDRHALVDVVTRLF